MLAVTAHLSARRSVPDRSGEAFLELSDDPGDGFLRLALVDRAQDLEYAADLDPVAVLAALAKLLVAMGHDPVALAREAAA